MEVETERQERKRTLDEVPKEVAVANDAQDQAFRFDHFDVDSEHWAGTNLITDQETGTVSGWCYRCRASGRPLVVVVTPQSHYSVFYQGGQAGTTLMRITTPVSEAADSVPAQLCHIATLYRRCLAPLQCDGDLVESEFLRLIDPSLPPLEPTVVTERVIVKARRAQGDTV